MTASNRQQTDSSAAIQLKLSVENLIEAHEQGKPGAAQAAIRFYEALWASGMSSEQLVEYRDLGLIAMIEADKAGLPGAQRAAADLYADIFVSNSVESIELPKYKPLADIANHLGVVDTRLAGIQSLLSGNVAFVKQVATLPAAMLSTAQQNVADNKSGKSAASTLASVYNLVQNPQSVSQLASQAIIAGAENLYHTYKADGANMDMPQRRAVAAQYRHLSAFDRVVAEGTDKRQTTLNVAAMVAIPASRISSTLGRADAALASAGKTLVETDAAPVNVGAKLKNAFGFPPSSNLAVAGNAGIKFDAAEAETGKLPQINRPAMYSMSSAGATEVTATAVADKILNAYRALSALEESLAERQEAIIAQGNKRANIVIAQQNLVNGEYENLTPAQRAVANTQALADDLEAQVTLRNALNLVRAALDEQHELLLNALPGGTQLAQLTEGEAFLEAELEARTATLEAENKGLAANRFQTLLRKDPETLRIATALEQTTNQRMELQTALNQQAEKLLASATETAMTPATKAQTMQFLTRMANAEVAIGGNLSITVAQSNDVLTLVEKEFDASLSRSAEATMER